MDSYGNKKSSYRNRNNDNCNKFNSLHDENQYDMQSMETDSQKSMEANTTAEAAILYYECISQQMENEIMELEKAIENCTATNKTQKQNIMDMQIQKQKMLSEFHEQYRKFEQKNAYISKLEIEIENVALFLQELITQKTEISNMKLAEIQIRNYIIGKFQTTCEELQVISLSYEKDIQQMQERINENKEVESQGEAYDNLIKEINFSIHIFNEQMNHLRWAIKNDSVICEQIKTEGKAIQTQFEMKLLEKKQELKNNILINQRKLCLLKNEFFRIKDQPKDGERFKQQLEKLQKKLAKKIHQKNEIDSEIELALFEIRAVEEENQRDLNQLESLKEDINNCAKDREELMNRLAQLKININDDYTTKDDILKNGQLCEMKIKHTVAEIEKLKLLQKQHQMKEELSSKLKQREFFLQEIDEFKPRRDDEKQKIINLKTELNTKTERINGLKSILHSINIHIHSNDNLEKENLINTYLATEYEQNISDKFIESQLAHLYEKICAVQPYVERLEEKLEESISESSELDQTILSLEKTLQKVTDEAKVCENSIQALKQNVYQGKCITQQDLNKKLNIMINGEKAEQAIVDKLREEIALLEEKKKRPLLSVENKPKSVANRTTRTKLKPVNYKEDEGAIISSPDSDIYTFK